MKKMLVLFVSLIALQACGGSGSGGSGSGDGGLTSGGNNSNSPTVFSEVNNHKLSPMVGTSGNNDFYYFLDTTTNSYTIRRLGDDANPHPAVYDKIPASATALDFGAIGSRFFATYTDQGTTKFLEYKGDNNWVDTSPNTPDFNRIPWNGYFYTSGDYSASPYAAARTWSIRTDQGGTPAGHFPQDMNGNGPQNKNPVAVNGTLFTYGRIQDVFGTYYRPVLFQVAPPDLTIDFRRRIDMNADDTSVTDYHAQALTYGIVDGTGVYLVGLQNKDNKSVNLLRASDVKQRWSPVKEFVAFPNQTQVIKTLDFKEGKFVLMVEKNLGGKLSCVLNISGDLKTFVENTKQNSSCLLLTNYGGVFRLYTSTNQDPKDPSKTVAKNYLAVTLYDSVSGKPIP